MAVANAAKGLSGTGILTIVFVVLKLCGVITWSWVWVLSPLWISFILSFLMFGCFLAFVAWTARH